LGIELVEAELEREPLRLADELRGPATSRAKARPRPARGPPRAPSRAGKLGGALGERQQLAAHDIGELEALAFES
jgi:hypothetical protein